MGWGGGDGNGVAEMEWIGRRALWDRDAEDWWNTGVEDEKEKLAEEEWVRKRALCDKSCQRPVERRGGEWVRRAGGGRKTGEFLPITEGGWPDGRMAPGPVMVFLF